MGTETASKQERMYAVCCCQNAIMAIILLSVGIATGIAGATLCAVGFGTRPADMFDTANTSMRVTGLVLVGVAILPLVISVCCWFFFFAWRHRSKHAGEIQPENSSKPALEEGTADPTIPAEQIPLMSYRYPYPQAQNGQYGPNYLASSQLYHRPPPPVYTAYPGSDSHDDSSIPLKFLPQAESIETRSRDFPLTAGNSFDIGSDRTTVKGSGQSATTGSGRSTARSSKRSVLTVTSDHSTMKGSDRSVGNAGRTTLASDSSADAEFVAGSNHSSQKSSQVSGRSTQKGSNQSTVTGRMAELGSDSSEEAVSDVDPVDRGRQQTTKFLPRQATPVNEEEEYGWEDSSENSEMDGTFSDQV